MRKENAGRRILFYIGKAAHAIRPGFFIVTGCSESKFYADGSLPVSGAHPCCNGRRHPEIPIEIPAVSLSIRCVNVSVRQLHFEKRAMSE
jgi:hypothetical protein